MDICGHLKSPPDLVSLAHKICDKYYVSLIRYMFDKLYLSFVCINMMKRYDAPNDLPDNPHNRYVLNILLMPSV